MGISLNYKAMGFPENCTTEQNALTARYAPTQAIEIVDARQKIALRLSLVLRLSPFFSNKTDYGTANS